MNAAPESVALRTTWGAYPTKPHALELWPGFVAVTNAFLDHASPRVAPRGSKRVSPGSRMLNEKKFIPLPQFTENSES